MWKLSATRRAARYRFIHAAATASTMRWSEWLAGSLRALPC
jgi:hypothetical protein